MAETSQKIMEPVMLWEIHPERDWVPDVKDATR